VTDSTIFKEANIWMHSGAFFDESEYILVDKGANGRVVHEIVMSC
jgi:hypothetical protein